MRTVTTLLLKNKLVMLLNVSLFLLISSQILASPIFQQQVQQEVKYMQYSGSVHDNQNNELLVFATISVVNSNISTVTNSDGNFSLKVPEYLIDGKIVVSMLGYKKKIIPIKQLKKEKNKIHLNISITKLSEVVFHLPKDASSLVRTMFRKRKVNNMSEHVLMTAFYREIIKKKRKNVSLAEAVVKVYKQPYSSLLNDKIKLYKTRKSTDYSKLDTVALKLQGGPFNALYVDLMKYPEYVFTEDTYDLYDFSFSSSTTVNERGVYVVKFKQKPHIKGPLYYGKLFIDSKTGALIAALYNINVTDKEKAAELFIKKKPKDIFVYPTAVSYRIDYREYEGKWQYGYSNVQLNFKIKRKGKMFNSTYSVRSEMAVTDWKINTNKEKPTYKERMRHSIIIGDEASGFSDPDFWGAYNVIEPDKSIESAIKKIRRKLIK